MAQTVKLVSPRLLKKNQDNPRLIFRQEELDELEESIKSQGILVPLTVFAEGKGFRLLDGERRWRCALKLGLTSVPVIMQPKPEKLQNLMMMFAIHHARTDWDPLPTALKLQELEQIFKTKHGRDPSETELASLASMSRGEIRRLKKLLNLPSEYRDELLAELEKPKSEQLLTVDHVLEASSAATALRKKGIVSDSGEEQLRRAIIKKFRSGVEQNTVAPRLLTKLARSVERQDVPITMARRVATKLINNETYSISAAYKETVEQADFEHSLEQLVDRVIHGLKEHKTRRYKISERLLAALRALVGEVERFSAK